MAFLNAPRTVGPKNVSEGLRAVPTSLTSVTTKDTWLLGMNFCNNTAGDITLLVTNAAGDQVLPTVSITGNTAYVVEYTYPPLLVGGLKWQAGGAGLVADLIATTRN